MQKDTAQEITQQINSLNDLAPEMEKLADLFAQPIISNELIDEYRSTPPEQREQWLAKQQPNIDVNKIIETDKLVYDLMSRLEIIFGSNQRIESLMAAQQQQNLQSAQKNQDKSYGIDQQD